MTLRQKKNQDGDDRTLNHYHEDYKDGFKISANQIEKDRIVPGQVIECQFL